MIFGWMGWDFLDDRWMGAPRRRRRRHRCRCWLACLRVELYVVVGFPLKCITPKRFIIKCVAEQLAEHCIMSINIYIYTICFLLVLNFIFHFFFFYFFHFLCHFSIV